MFRSKHKRSGRELIDALHMRIVEASRRPESYGPGLWPDTTEGRFESLTVHALLVLRRLRDLPPPADDVAQDLIDAVFAHLEIALREMGIGDFGVPKRMKKLAQAFYDRTARYDLLLDRADEEGLAAELGTRLETEPATLMPLARLILHRQASLSGADLDAILRRDLFQPGQNRAASGAVSEPIG